MMLTVVEGLVLAGGACVMGYCLMLCLASLVAWSRSREAPLIWPRHVFAVLIPAHNTESTIGQTIERFLQRIQYPRDLFDLIVIPVRCLDRTAAIARQKGAIVYERGHGAWTDRDDAIQSTIERLLAKRRHDAFIILETTVEVSPNFLGVMSDKLSKGAKVIQAGYRVTGPFPSWAASVAAGVRAVSIYLCPLLSHRPGLSLGLQRVGVCLARSIVEKYGVRTPSVTDGLAYAARLLLDHVLVTFAPKAVVSETAPPDPAPADRPVSQRVIARCHLIRDYTLPLLWSGVRGRSAAQMSGAINTLIPPFPWLFSGTLVLLILSTLAHRLTPHPYSARLVIGWECMIAGQMVMAVSGFVRGRVPALVYLTLPSIPLYLLWQAYRSWTGGWNHAPDEVVSQGRVFSAARGALPGRRVMNRHNVR